MTIILNSTCNLEINLRTLGGCPRFSPGASSLNKAMSKQAGVVEYSSVFIEVFPRGLCIPWIQLDLDLFDTDTHDRPPPMQTDYKC